MYAVKINNQLVAYHEKKKVVVQFMEDYHFFNPKDYISFGKIKGREIEFDLVNNHLEEVVEDFYLPEIYIDAYEVFIKSSEIQNSSIKRILSALLGIDRKKGQFLYQDLKDGMTLLETMFLSDIPAKRKRHIIKLYRKLIRFEREFLYVPSIHELEVMYVDLLHYTEEIGGYEDIGEGRHV